MAVKTYSRAVIVLLILLLTPFVSCLPYLADGQEKSIQFDYIIKDDNTAEITGLKGDISDERIMTIPSELDGYEVTSIGKWALPGLDKMQTLELPETMKNIDDYAFCGCRELEDLRLPEGLIRIGDGAFSLSKSLKNVTLPESLITLDERAFEEAAFTTVKIPASVENMSGNPFSACENLIFIDLDEDNKVFEMREGVLFDKEDHRLVCYPCTFTASEYTIPDDIKIVGRFSFINSKYLKKVNIPDGLKKVSYFAFANCGLTQIDVPASVEIIEANGFNACYDCESIILHEGLTEIEGAAFSAANGVREIILPEGLTVLRGSAFAACSRLLKVSLPDTLTKVEGNPFAYCSNLSTIEVSMGNPALEVIDGVLYNVETKQIVCYPIALQQSEYVIPDGTMIIENDTFAYCDKLERIIIPEGIIKIGSGAFSHCKRLSDIVLPTGVTYIGAYAFTYCESLNYFEVPYGVEEMSNDVFAGCSKLKTIRLPDTLVTIHEEAFDYVGSDDVITSFIVPFNSYAEEFCRDHGFLYEIGQYDDNDAIDGFEYVINNNETVEIRRYTGDGVVVHVPDEIDGKPVTVIGEDAFARIGGISEVRLPEGCEKILDKAFNDCVGLKVVNIPASVSWISDNAFDGVDNLELCVTDRTYGMMYAIARGIPYRITMQDAVIEENIEGDVLLEEKADGEDAGNEKGLWVCPDCGAWNTKDKCKTCGRGRAS